MLVSRMTPCIVDGMLWPVLESTIFNETELAPMLFVATDVVINKMAMKPNIEIKIYKEHSMFNATNCNKRN
jgi:hypothetical protein